MEIKNVKISELKSAEYNPRTWSEEEMENLKESIRRFGIVDPFIVNSAPERKNIIIGGHFRLEAVRQLGIGEVPVVYVNIPDIEKEKELNLRLNRNLGKWDFNLLKGFDESLLKNVGFTAEELDNVFGLEMADEFDEKEELEKAIKDPRGVKDGDIWQLGEHKLIIGDCTKREIWEKLLGEERFDLMETDPPYNIAANKMGSKGFGRKGNRSYSGLAKRGVPEYNKWLSIANNFQNPKGANVMIFEDWKNVVAIWNAIEQYWKIKNMIVWFLPNRGHSYSRKRTFFNKYDIAPLAGEGVVNQEYEKELDDYLQEKGQKLLDNYEVIIYGQIGESNFEKKKGSKWAGINDHITWVAGSEKSTDQNLVFGTKPIQILVPYIKILSPREGIVMEPFAGSGSTIIAGEIMKRKVRAIEIVPTYGEVILNRFQKYTGIEPIKIG